MSRSLTGYFTEPLTQVERDLIYPHAQKHYDYVMHDTIADLLERKINEATGCFDEYEIPGADMKEFYYQKAITEWGKEILNLHDCDEFTNFRKYNVQLVDGVLVFSQAIKNLLENRTSDYSFPIAGLIHNPMERLERIQNLLIDYANNNIALFPFPASQYTALNDILEEYITKQIDRSEIGPGRSKDHSKIIKSILDVKS